MPAGGLLASDVNFQSEGERGLVTQTSWYQTVAAGDIVNASKTAGAAFNLSCAEWQEGERAVLVRCRVVSRLAVISSHQ